MVANDGEISERSGLVECNDLRDGYKNKFTARFENNKNVEMEAPPT